MKNTIFIIPFAFALLLLSACFGPQTPYDINYYTGKDALALSFYTGAPPDSVFDNSDITVEVSAHNKGTSELNSSRKGSLVLTYDEYFFETPTTSRTPGTYTAAEDLILDAKSQYWPNGEDKVYAITNLKVKPLQGQIGAPSTQIMVTACYPYTTLLTNEICMDTNIYSQDVRTQVCQAENLDLEDQGAPVAIKTVEMTFLPEGIDYVRPRFQVHVENVGDGVVLNADSEVNLKDLCALRSADKWNENRLSVKAWLSGKQLECSPDDIRVVNNEADFMCQTAEKIPVKPNYRTSLTFKIDYIYTNSVSKTIQIKRL